MPIPYEASAEELKAVADRHGLQHVLINTKRADKVDGLGCRKELKTKFAESFEETLVYAKTLGCSMYVKVYKLVYCFGILNL